MFFHASLDLQSIEKIHIKDIPPKLWGTGAENAKDFTFLV